MAELILVVLQDRRVGDAGGVVDAVQQVVLGLAPLVVQGAGIVELRGVDRDLWGQRVVDRRIVAGLVLLADKIKALYYSVPRYCATRVRPSSHSLPGSTGLSVASTRINPPGRSSIL